MVHKTKVWLVVLYIFVYAIVSPIGIGIGMALSNADDSKIIAILSVVLQGLASGTLLYVIFFEILIKHKDGIIQYFSVVFGFVLMLGFKLTGNGKLNIAECVSQYCLQLVIIIFMEIMMENLSIVTLTTINLENLIFNVAKKKERVNQKFTRSRMQRRTMERKPQVIILNCRFFIS